MHKFYVRWHQLRRHVDDSTVRTCQGCGATLLNAQHLQKHLRADPECLRVHRSGRERPGVYSCFKCGLKCPAKRQTLLDHLRLMHYSDKPTESACKTCDKTFFNPLLLEAHEKRMHLPQQKQQVKVVVVHPKVIIADAFSLAEKPGTTQILSERLFYIFFQI